MKALVVSDNHSDSAILEELIDIYDDIDLWLHCGDSELYKNHSVWKKFKTVTGNMDFEPDFPEVTCNRLDDTTIVALHGHKHRIKRTLDLMEEVALKYDADIVFYGHSHIAQVDKQNDIFFINPGSISQPRGDLRIGSYAIFEKIDDESFIRFYDWNHNELKDLSEKLI